MPKHKFYAVMVPFEIEDGNKEHKEVLQIAGGLLKRLQRKGKDRVVCPTVLQLNKDTRAALKDKWPEDTVLYLTCHGNPALLGTKSLDITPTKLAEDLVAMIPNNLRHLKIMSCNSGVGFSDACSFASKVCILLSNHFPGLTVYGYIGFTGEQEKNPKHSYVTEELNKGRLNLASQSRIAVTGSTATLSTGPFLKFAKESEKTYEADWKHVIKCMKETVQPLPMGTFQAEVDVGEDL